MKDTYHRNHWQNVVQGGNRQAAKQKAHLCMVMTEGLIYGYSDQLTEKERRAALDAKRTYERIVNRLRKDGVK